MEKPKFALKLLVIGLLLVGLASSSGAQTLSQTTGSVILFGAAHLGQDGLSSLYTIDTATGAATLVGPIGFERCGGMDFDSSGTLYATCEQVVDNPDPTDLPPIVLVTIDLATGAGTEVGLAYLGDCCFGASWTVHDLSIRSDDTLFGHLGRVDSLATFDLTMGIATFVGETGLVNMNTGGNGLAFSPNGTLYNAETSEKGVGDGALYTVNPDTGVATFLISTTFPAPGDERPRINAMDFIPETDILFASLNDGDSNSPENYLATINIGTGEVAIVGRTVNGLDAIAFIPEEELPPPTTSDLIAQKSNDVNGIGEVEVPFNWTINVANIGVSDATFDSGQALLRDMLPNSPTYGSPMTVNFSGTITGSNFIACNITTDDTLNCTATGGSVIMGSNSRFDVVFSVTQAMSGLLNNPIQDGICQVDPDGTAIETDENNNDCIDSVMVDEKPTAIALVFFQVEANGDQAIVTWETATEIDNAGFNIYRALSLDGPWVQVNDTLIAAEGDPVSGANYTFIDQPGRGTFYYRLEDIDFFGVSTLHEPALVEMGAVIRVPWYRPIPPEF